MTQPIVSAQRDSGKSTAAGVAARVSTLVAENPTVVLFIVFVVLILVTGVIEPNYLSVGGCAPRLCKQRR